jgi:hypothetical protein
MKWADRIGRRMKLRHLHIVLAVAEAGSMTRAAEELAASYPVVSKTISELEHALGAGRTILGGDTHRVFLFQGALPDHRLWRQRLSASPLTQWV